jgi:hypothetical protein
MNNSPGKNFAYSNCHGRFVNDFNHTRWVAPPGVAGKRVDSSSVSEKPCPWLIFEGPQCGKTEEASGKEDSAKMRRCAEYNQGILSSSRALREKISTLEKIKPTDVTENVFGRIYFGEYGSGAGTSSGKTGRFAGSAREQETLPKTGIPL